MEGKSDAALEKMASTELAVGGWELCLNQIRDKRASWSDIKRAKKAEFIPYSGNLIPLARVPERVSMNVTYKYEMSA